MSFESDQAKDKVNRERHGISFEEAEEERFIAIGPIRTGIIVIIYTNDRTPLSVS